MEFYLKMIPPTVTAQEHKVGVRNGKPYFYDPPELKQARAKLLAHLGQYVPDEKITVPCSLEVSWRFPLTGKHQEGEFKSTKPDTDNLQKLLKDCMTQCGFWKDDALVCEEHVEKVYSKHCGIVIRVEEL